MSITAHRMTGGDTGIKERLQMLAPSLAAPLYPFALEGFNASVTRIVEGGAANFRVRVDLCLLRAYMRFRALTCCI